MLAISIKLIFSNEATEDWQMSDEMENKFTPQTTD
jgi:hypothetical protein